MGPMAHGIILALVLNERKVIMESSSLFIRGQVWYWEDPIYGRKENNIEISIGEATLRYSRYCIIAQTTNTITKSSILVIPCSSCNHTPHDVPSPLSHVFHENFTYARTIGLFPVHPKFLQRYVCTLSDQTMKQIESELVKLLMPSFTSIIDDDEFMDRFGININASDKHTTISKSTSELEIITRSFIRDHLVKSDLNDIISAYELKDAFNQYCIINNRDIVDDIVEFLDTFTKVTNNPGYHFSDKGRFNLIEFKGIRIKEDFKLSISIDEKDLINPDDSQKAGKWDDDTIKEFIKIYNDDGLEIAAEKFDLKQSTATNYWYRWKDKFENTEIPKVIVKLPNAADSPKSISKVSNMIRDTLKDQDIYPLQSKYMISEEAIINESSFYSIIGTCVYYSLLDFLSIKKDDDGNFFIPTLNENTKYISTWHFFDTIYHDKKISVTKNGKYMMILYRKHFPSHDGIDSMWLDKLRLRLENRLNMNADGIMEICKIINNEYCART